MADTGTQVGHLGISRKLDHILEDGELNAGKTEFLGSNLNNADLTDAILANGKTSTVLSNNPTSIRLKSISQEMS